MKYQIVRPHFLIDSRLCQAVGLVDHSWFGDVRSLDSFASEDDVEPGTEIIPSGFDLIAREPGIAGVDHHGDRRGGAPCPALFLFLGLVLQPSGQSAPVRLDSGRVGLGLKQRER